MGRLRGRVGRRRLNPSYMKPRKALTGLAGFFVSPRMEAGRDGTDDGVRLSAGAGARLFHIPDEEVAAQADCKAYRPLPQRDLR